MRLVRPLAIKMLIYQGKIYIKMNKKKTHCCAFSFRVGELHIPNTSPDPAFLLVSTKNGDLWARSDFSVIKSRTAQNQREEQDFGQNCCGLVALFREIRVGKIGKSRHPDNKETM